MKRSAPAQKTTKYNKQQSEQNKIQTKQLNEYSIIHIVSAREQGQQDTSNLLFNFNFGFVHFE